MYDSLEKNAFDKNAVRYNRTKAAIKEKTKTINKEKYMRADEMAKRFKMEAHPENGSFMEHHFIKKRNNRASSGSIYYYVPQGEKTKFHRLDCDEYWCYNAGATLELWIFDKNGVLHKHFLGIEEGAVPIVLIKKGEIFASRLPKNSGDGAFISCITVPAFSYEGFELIEKDEMLNLYPESAYF